MSVHLCVHIGHCKALNLPTNMTIDDQRAWVGERLEGYSHEDRKRREKLTLWFGFQPGCTISQSSQAQSDLSMHEYFPCQKVIPVAFEQIHHNKSLD